MKTIPCAFFSSVAESAEARESAKQMDESQRELCGGAEPYKQAGPAKTLKTSQYRSAALSFSSSDLKF